MIAYRKRPGMDWEEIQIDGSVAQISEEVGGCFRFVRMFKEGCIAYNPAAESMGHPYNCRYMGTTFFGTFLVVGMDGEQITDLILNEEARKWVLG